MTTNFRWLTSTANNTLQVVLVALVTYAVSNPEEMRALLPAGVVKYWPLAFAVLQAVMASSAMSRHPDTGRTIKPMTGKEVKEEIRQETQDIHDNLG